MPDNLKAYFPDLALVELAKKDDLGSGVNLTTLVSSWTESGFGRDTDSDAYFGNAKVKYRKPQDDGEVSFDVAVTNAMWHRIFHGGTGSDFTSGSTQADYRVTILLKDALTTVTQSLLLGGSSAGSAVGSLTGSGTALRIVYANAALTSFEPELKADEYVKGKITFTVPPMDETGFGNIRVQQKDVNIFIPPLGSYTSTAKW